MRKGTTHTNASKAKNAQAQRNNAQAKRGSSSNESAVSPVIGVILMVAITVILAAIIAAFVFGMSGNIEKPHNTVVTLEKVTSGLAHATVQKGEDIAGFIVNVNEGSYINYVGNTSAPLGDQPLQVGTVFSVMTSQGVRQPGQYKDHVVITAVYLDESKGVVLDTFL